MTAAASGLEQRIQQIDTLVAQIEQSTDAATQNAAREMVRALLDLHAAGLGRMISLLAQAGDVGREVLDAWAEDQLVGHLLLLHGLHPESLEERVSGALEEARPYLQSHGGNVELVRIEEGTVFLHLQGSCHGCPSSRATLQSTIERAIHDAAPEVTGVEVEGQDELIQIG
jgi:Fe-S cluster biogenesis protein NfuA